MERSKETTVTIAELAQQERANSEAAAQEILSALKETGGSAQPQVSAAEILSSPEHQVQTTTPVQIITNPLFVNEEKNGNKTDDAKTWKDKADKRKVDKASRRS